MRIFFARQTAFSLLGLPSRHVLLTGFLLALVVLISAGMLMWRELQYATQRDLRQLELLAQVMEAHATQVFETGLLALDTLAEDARDLYAETHTLQTELAQSLRGLYFVRSMAVLSPEGVVKASTNPLEQGVHIDLHRLGALPQEGNAAIGPWVAGRSLAHLNSMTPALDAPPGLGFIPLVRSIQFAVGPKMWLVALVNPDALATYQRQITQTGPQGTEVLLTTLEGDLLSRVGPGPMAQTWPLSSHLVFQELLARHSKGTFDPDVDRERRLGAWRVSPSQALVTVVQHPYASTRAQWLASLRGPLLFMAVAVVLITLMTLGSWRSIRVREVAQRERDEALRQTARSEEELSTLVKSVQDLIFRTTPDGAIVFVNAHWQTITERPAQAALGGHLRDMVHPQYRTAVAALFVADAGGNAVRRARASLIGTTGQERVLDIAVVPLYDRGEVLRGFAGSATDVTALLAAQERVEEQLAFSHLLLEISPLPTCMVDPEGCFLSVNRAWEDFMGLSRESVLGLRSVDVLPPQDAQVYETHNLALLHGGGTVRYQERLRRPDGSHRDVQITKVVVPAKNATPLGVLIVKMDVTEFLAARDLAEQASRSKSEFVANISHELRTPLQSILGFSELGMLRGRNEAKLAAMFSDIHAAGQRMLELVNDLLDIAKIESSVGAFHFERHDVRLLIDLVCAELRPLLERKQLQLQVQQSSTPLWARVDPVRFQQVVRNVLANAVKFSPEHVAIEVSATTSSADEIHIQVRDYGPGIPPAELETVFQAFVQSSQTRDGAGGTGLGLAISRKILIAHGGRIVATNATGAGSIFHIFVPAMPAVRESNTAEV